MRPFSPTAHTSEAAVPWTHQNVSVPPASRSLHALPSKRRTVDGLPSPSGPPTAKTSDALVPHTDSRVDRWPETTTRHDAGAGRLPPLHDRAQAASAKAARRITAPSPGVPGGACLAQHVALRAGAHARRRGGRLGAVPSDHEAAP